MQNKRKGNLILTLMVTTGATLMITTMLSLATTQRLRTKDSAERAGDLTSYITFANLCADAFRDDLESQFAEMVVATVEDVEGVELTFSDYMSLVQDIQAPLVRQAGDVDVAAPEWLYVLHDAAAPIEYVGLDTTGNADFVAFYKSLLQGAKLEIRVDEPLAISGATVDNLALTYGTGDRLLLNDIYYTVTLEKGTTRLIQHYKLTGEYVRFIYSDVFVRASVSGERASNVLIAQTATQTAVRHTDPNDYISY